MIYGSVCSGIEAATAAWHGLGWKPAFFSEIEAFPRAVLAHHYPDVPLHGDFTTIQKGQYAAIDLLVGGTPCQSFSVAGLRAGLDDPRGNLMLEFGALARRLGPTWLVWENVPGVLSSNKGRDFGTFLGMLGELGYGFAYRVLDAQYFGVAQRRRRVFVVGYLGDWRPAAAVLFERHSLQGHPAPSRQAGEGIAATVSASAPSRRNGGSSPTEGHFVAGTIGARTGRSVGAQDAACGHMVATLCVSTGQAGAEIGADMAPTLNCNHEAPYIARALNGERFDASDDAKNKFFCHVCGEFFEDEHATEVGGLVPVECPLCGEDGAIDRAEMVPTLNCNHEAPYIAHTIHTNVGRSDRGDGNDNLLVEPFTLAIRGRKDGHHLEYRQDGTANALLTPNGGRGGIGVGAIAYRTAGDGAVYEEGDATAPLTTGTDPSASIVQVSAFSVSENSNGFAWESNVHPTLQTGNKNPMSNAFDGIRAGMQVRRLTPRECERLQGFKDDYTLITFRNKPAADGPRYKALGNSMAVPCMHWIGSRIQAVSELMELEAAA